ncbi:MAG TPA: PSD1 and planctomycete cytochrome C domain-containing protein [Pirellulaceae bacterium]|nr:PSD1 and planctomycete cytochrome C domain-containing protein [Pirellulaceae bacterium]
MRAMHGIWLAALAVVGLAGLHSARAEPGDDAAQIEFFEKRIRPILADNCYNCHSANTNSKGGLRVDDRQGLVAGGSRGAAIVPGDPEGSLLIKAVRQENNKGLKMPAEEGKLSPEQIADLVQWIQNGAAWPQEELPAELGQSHADYENLQRTHWAWQPLVAAPPPEVRDAAWVRDDIDRFILATLEAKELAPVAAADKVTLIRRVTFDLTGLQPTPEEIDAFVADSSAQAFDKVVDRLLASPAFGERWGRHWLDVARYGESTGSARNIPYPHAWRYRDWVIAAFNADKPYHQFLREQIAGDLLPANSPREKAEQLIATGFLALGVKDVNQRFKVRFIMDNVDEQIDTVSRAVLGLTVSCARCHDHKFDPIPTTDYYALAGIFRSTDLCAGVRNKMGGGGLDYYDTALLLDVGADASAKAANEEKIAAAKAAFEKARAEFQAISGTPAGKAIGEDGKPKQFAFRQRMNKAQQDLHALTDPAASGNVALGVRDAKQVSDTEIRIRGEAEKLGPVVPRGYLAVVRVPDAPPINPEQSGRLELARWLTSPQNPLTSRVMANRIWQHLFGQGLVRTVDNFGVNGDSPSHPELLDHLAARFVREGWSVKKLVRAIALSRTYQLGGDAPPANLAVDPANRLVWRHSPRRLDAEEIRDAMLAAAGNLNLTPPAASPAKDFAVREIRNNGPEATALAKAAAASRHRSVYLPLVRGVTPTSLAAFDFAEQGMVTGSRDSTTVATQALYLLNDPLVREQSLALAERLLAESGESDAQRIALAYRLIFGRMATTEEIERAVAYVAAYESAYQADVTAIAAQPTGPAEVAAGDASLKPPPAAADANPDDIDRSDATAKEEVIRPSSPTAAAWASFCQALLGSAEFRFVR